MMKENFEHLMKSYPTAKKEIFSRHPLGEFVRQTIVKSLYEESKLNKDRYLIQGSVGQGNWAEVPWICIFDKDITKSARKGYYIVYLFCADGSGMYLSLNQGYTHYKDLYKKEAKYNIANVSRKCKTILRSSLDDFPVHEINLKCTNDLGKGYELGHICGKYYSIDQMQNDFEMIDDLRNLIGVYRELKGLVKARDMEEILNVSVPYDQKDLTSIIFDKTVDSDLEETFQHSVYTSKASKTPRKPQEKKKKKTRLKEQWSRDSRISKEALIQANYCCQMDEKHMTFQAETTKENFVEAHHLIPISVQDEFRYSLDVPGNILALCPNCHRAIHYSEWEQRKSMILKMFLLKKQELKVYGIEISQETLLNYYKIENK